MLLCVVCTRLVHMMLSVCITVSAGVCAWGASVCGCITCVHICLRSGCTRVQEGVSRGTKGDHCPSSCARGTEQDTCS